MTRLELAASTTPKWRATSCATPRNPPCFPQSHYIIALDFQNVNRFVKNCCTTFSKNLFFFCGILTKSPRWAGLREFSPFNGVPDAAFSVRLLPFLPTRRRSSCPSLLLRRFHTILPPVAPAPPSPYHSTAHLSCPAVSIPFYCPHFPFTLPLSRRPRQSHNAAPRQIATKCE